MTGCQGVPTSVCGRGLPTCRTPCRRAKLQSCRGRRGSGRPVRPAPPRWHRQTPSNLLRSLCTATEKRVGRSFLTAPESASCLKLLSTTVAPGSATNTDEKILAKAVQQTALHKNVLCPARPRLTVVRKVREGENVKTLICFCYYVRDKLKLLRAAGLVFPRTMPTVACCNQMLLAAISIHPIRD